MRLSLRLLAIAPLLGSCAASIVPHVELAGAAFAPVFAGETQKGAGNPALDIDDDLGVEDREIAPYGSVAVEWIGLRAQVSGFDATIDGDATLSGAFGSLPAGTSVDSEARLRNLRGALLIDGIDAGILKIKPGVGVDFFDLELEAESVLLGASERVDARAAVPLVVLVGELDLGAARAVVDVGAMRGSYGDAEGTFVDGEATLRLPLAGPAEIFAGYRYLRCDLEGTSDGAVFDSTLRFHGPLAGLALRF